MIGVTNQSRAKKAPPLRKLFNTLDGAKIGQSFHDQVAAAIAGHPDGRDVIFAMSFAALINGMKNEQARLFMRCALGAECEAIRNEAGAKAA